jgi:E3 ubiquitin-protein ligase HERC2
VFACDLFLSSSYHASDADPAKFLPISHTCFFSIELPRYRTLDEMHARLSLAITHCDTIDADGTSNGMANGRMAIGGSAAADDDDASGPSLFQ